MVRLESPSYLGAPALSRMSSLNVNGNSLRHEKIGFMNKRLETGKGSFLVRPGPQAKSPKLQRKVELNATLLQSYSIKAGDIVSIDNRNGAVVYAAAYPAPGQISSNGITHYIWAVNESCTTIFGKPQEPRNQSWRSRNH